MESLKQIGSYFTWNSQASDSKASASSKFGKIAAGVGVAGLAIISWKIVAAGAFAYSAYRGGQYVHSRYFQKHEIRRRESRVSSQVVDEPEELHNAQIVNASHDAPDDRQHEKTEEEKRIEIIEGLRRQQAQYSSQSIKKTFEILISHPDIGVKGNDIQWVRKMIKKHGPWVKRTAGLSLPIVKAFRKVKACLPPKNK